MELVLLSAAFIGAMAISLDIALAMIFACAVLLVATNTVPIHLIAEKSVAQISLYPLLAIPGFIVAGELMNLTGLTRSLGELARLHAEAFGYGERGVGRKVTVLGLLRPLKLELRGNRLPISERLDGRGEAGV